MKIKVLSYKAKRLLIPGQLSAFLGRKLTVSSLKMGEKTLFRVSFDPKAIRYMIIKALFAESGAAGAGLAAAKDRMSHGII